jgi:hypothetical protein
VTLFTAISFLIISIVLNKGSSFDNSIIFYISLLITNNK